MTSRRLGGLAVLGCAAAIAGCGSGGSRHESRSPTSTSSASRSTPSGLGATKSPKQIVAEASAALRAAHGFTAQGSIVEGRLRVSLRLVAASPTSLDVSIVVGTLSAELIGTRDGSFLRANRAFWVTHGGARAATLADRWIEVPLSTGRAFAASLGSLGSLAPDALARCLAEDHGSLSIAGTITIEHRRAIVIKDAGDVPGSSPGVLIVAATGTPYPLTYTATGGQRAGGRIDVCNQGTANTAHGTITFGDFGHVRPISPPANPLRFAQPPSI